MNYRYIIIQLGLVGPLVQVTRTVAGEVSFNGFIFLNVLPDSPVEGSTTGGH